MTQDLVFLLAKTAIKYVWLLAVKKKGKSGGARVITYLYLETETIYLLTIYDKSEKANLKQKELKEMIDSLQWNI